MRIDKDILRKRLDNTTGRNRECMLNVRVIAKSNEPEPPELGMLIGFEGIGRNNTPIPIVRFERTGKYMVCMGAVVPYSDELYSRLMQKPVREQWEYLKMISMRWD